MKFTPLIAFVVVAAATVGRAADDLPLHPDDLQALLRIAEREKLDAPPEAAKPGWPLQKGERGVRFTARENPRHMLLVVHDENGRVTSYRGNGPILGNASFTDVARLPELRAIRIDHNVPGPGSPVDIELYDGSGFSALADSKLEEVKIGHAFDDDGMAALAKVKSLRIAQIGHSRATDAGVAHLIGHPNVEEFRISSQARPNRVTNKCLPSLAKMPKLKRLGLHETFVTYADGLEHLKALKETLEFVSFKNALVLPADVEKLKADHPGLEVETSTPAEILASPNSRGVLRWASPEALKWLQSSADSGVTY
jgi:hypothetical protein